MTSRIEEADLKRLQGQEKRIQNQLSEKRARADQKRVIDVDAVEEVARAAELRLLLRSSFDLRTP